eukprot:167695-Rhodomonas_salina.2
MMDRGQMGAEEEEDSEARKRRKRKRKRRKRAESRDVESSAAFAAQRAHTQLDERQRKRNGKDGTHLFQPLSIAPEPEPDEAAAATDRKQNTSGEAHASTWRSSTKVCPERQCEGCVVSVIAVPSSSIE